MKQALEHATVNGSVYEQQLFDFLRIPSISADPAFASECQTAAEWVATQLRAIGLTTEVIPTQRHPLIYAEWQGAGDNAKTVLIYGHYDVQPAVKSDGWDTEPFEPIVKDGFLFGRGSSDDKGQLYTHVKAVEAILKAEGKLPVNIKFIIEGEEESGGQSIAKFIREQGERLKADVCVISDTSMSEKEQPVIIYGLRGGVAMDLTVFGPSHDLHSGMYGGSVHNPNQALAEIISQLHNADGSVAVDGFYDTVRPLDPAEREALTKGAYVYDVWQSETGAPQAWGENDYTLSERIGARPTLEITGMAGGYFEAGMKAVIPSKAWAKISCRLVADQDPQAVFELVKQHIEKITPPTVTVEMKYLFGFPPALVDIHHPTMQVAITAYKNGWGAEPIFKREGGSIPFVSDIQNHVGLPVIMLGYGLNSDGIHGPNEHYSLEMFHRGIQTNIHFLYEMASL